MTRFHEWVPDTPFRMLNKDGRPVDPRQVDELLRHARKSGDQFKRDQAAMSLGYQHTNRAR